MANTREIQSRMKSIQDTMKITNAMYMISSTKLKKAKKSLEDTEPYFYTLQGTISRILRHVPDIDHVFFNAHGIEKEEDRKKGYLIITADKGLAGAYNHNVLKRASEEIEKDPNAELFVVGELGRQYFEHQGIKVAEQIHYTAQNPTLHRARMIGSRLVELYLNGDLDEISVIYTKMVNSVEAEVAMEKILPLSRANYAIQIPMDVYQEEFYLLPTPEVVLDHIVPTYVTGFVYGALTESFCSEQNARMMAMDAAGKSAQDLLHELSILYNRVRQAAITQEITEVCSGARAQKKKK